MRLTANTDWAQKFMRTLGEELRKTRQQRGWTRKDLLDRLGADISLQMLTGYELGTRRINVIRLTEITTTLKVSPLDLLQRTYDRLDGAESATIWDVDLIAATSLKRPELRPLRRWAQTRLHTLDAGESTIVQLNMNALRPLAELCTVSTADLIRTLRRPRHRKPSNHHRDA